MAAQQVLEQAVTMMAQQIEANVDKELTRLDNLGDNDLEQIRQQRMSELRKRQEKSKEWMERGHGEYTEIQTEQDFFKTIKASTVATCQTLANGSAWQPILIIPFSGAYGLAAGRGACHLPLL
jgi:hypothetical protein